MDLPKSECLGVIPIKVIKLSMLQKPPIWANPRDHSAPTFNSPQIG